MCGFSSTIVAGGTESMSLVPMGGNKVSPNPALVDSYPDVYLTTGLVAENHARESSHLARGSGRVRAAQPSARDRGHRRRTIRGRNRAGDREARRAADGNGSRRSASWRSRSTKDRGAIRLPTRSRKLRPAFHARGTVTAGNSSQTSDGASAVVVTSADRARERGLDAAGPVRRVRDGRRRTRAIRPRTRAGDPEGR